MLLRLAEYGFPDAHQGKFSSTSVLCCRVAWHNDALLIAGVLLNHMFPVWLITILLVCLLSFLTHKTLQKGLRLYQAERSVPADEPELHLVQIHPISVEGNDNHPVHNLLRSISEEPNAPSVEIASAHPSLPTIAESQKHNSTVDVDQKAPAKHQEVALTIVSSAADSFAQQHFPEAILDKSGQLNRSTSHSSTQSLKIKSEAAGPSVAEAASLTDPSAALSRMQTGDSFSQVSVLSCASGSSSLEDLAALLPKSSSSPSLAADQLQDLPPSSVLYKQTIVPQQCLDQVRRHALSHLPKSKILAAGGMWAVFAALQLAKGQLRACSVGYWAGFVIQAGSLLAASLFFVQQASTNQQRSMSADVAPLPMSGDQSIKVPTVLRKASAVAVGGGALASTIGMGGGVIMGPLLLSLQVHPLVTAATSTLMILFSSSAATLSFAVAGNINTEYALIYGVCNSLSSFAGVLLIGKVVRKTGKSAVIVILLACIMAAGALASAVFGGHESVRNFQTGTNLTFSSICS